jgi:hypothetical protein
MSFKSHVYDRRRRKVTRNIVERIPIGARQSALNSQTAASSREGSTAMQQTLTCGIL